MKLLRVLFFTVVSLVAAFFVISMFLPKAAHVERSISIAASPQTVYGLVDGFARFNEWSPWARLDPKARGARSHGRP